MDTRPRILWRRRSLFVAVVIAVMIGSTISVLAATNSPSAKRYYACVAGTHKTLNLTSADATCPEGQRKISFGSAQRGPKGATGAQGAAGPAGPKGAAGAKGATGAAGVDGKAGATGPEGKAGPEGKQGPAGTGSGSPGPDGKEGPQGVPGPEGKQGKEGPEGQQGKEGPEGKQGKEGPEGKPGTSGSIVYAASSGEPVVLTTLPAASPARWPCCRSAAIRQGRRSSSEGRWT